MSSRIGYTAYLVGKKESIEEFNKISSIHCTDKDYKPKTSFLKELNLQKDLNNFHVMTFELEEYRKLAKEKNNKYAISRLKDENLKKEDYVNIPEEKHFFGIYKYSPNETFKKIGKDLFFSKGSGELSSCLKYCFGSRGFSMYESSFRNVPEKIFYGTCLREFCREHPDLRIAIVTFDLAEEYSDLVYFSNGGLRIQEEGNIEKSSILSGTLAEWYNCDYLGDEDEKETDEEMTLDHLKLYSKPYYNEEYVFGLLKLKKEDM